MDKKGLYRAALLLLILLNLAAVGIFCYRRMETRRSGEELSLAARNYFTALGVSLASGLPGGGETLREVIPFSRDAEGETAFALGITGSSERIHRGGQVYTYSGPRGDCTFLGGGELVASVTDCGIREKSGKKAKKALLGWLSDRGLDLSGAVSVLTPDGDGWRMELSDTIAGVSVSNEKLVVLCGKEGFLTVSGTWRMGTAGEVLSSGPVSQAAALSRYGASRRDRIPFTRVDRITPVYWLYQEQNGGVTLLPALKLFTDRGSVVINAMTGEALGS